VADQSCLVRYQVNFDCLPSPASPTAAATIWLPYDHLTSIQNGSWLTLQAARTWRRGGGQA